MDRLQTLRVFVAVATAESFASGARAVGISAPSATRGINELEAMLGTRLFTRTTRQVRLTDVGRSYLEEVRDILASLQAADDAAMGAAAMPVGHLRITCPQEFGRIYIAPIVTAFLDRYPAVSLDVLMVDRVVNIVEEGFDIALRIGALPSSGLAALRVGEVRKVVCGAPAYFARHARPLTPAELDSHCILSVGHDTERHWRFGAGGRQSVGITPRLNVSSIAAAIAIARGGWGLCQLLSYQVGSDLEAGTLEAVLQSAEPDPQPIHLVHIDGRRASAKVRAFLDFAAASLRGNDVLNRKG